MPTPASLGAPPRLAALLRAVNVGGRKLKMAELRACLESEGYRDVQTLLASGNVVLRSPAASIDAMGERLGELIEARFGLRSEVIVRQHADLARALSVHPFAGDEAQGARLHVVFLREAPEPERVAALDPLRSPPDRVAVIGREAYLHYPEGSGRSRLTLDWLERQLGTVGTARNVNTVARLVSMTAPDAVP